MIPGITAISGFENAISHSQIRPVESFSRAYIDDVGMSKRNRNISYRSGGGIIENGIPGAAVVIGFPDPAIIDPHIKDVRLGWYPHPSHGAAGPEGAGQAVFQFLVVGLINGLSYQRGR